jgi:RimJ/RimL family protein N-acetyltransferase
MENDMLKGKLVRLVALEPDTAAAEAFWRWGANSEYQRLCSTDYALQYSTKKWKEWLEKDAEKDPPSFHFFAIHTLADDRLIGGISLDGGAYPSGETFVGIGIGDEADWGKGYGSDAMNIILRYAFHELNLRRVALDTFEYNPRGIRSYEKVGFVHEGCMRGYLNRDGRRWDMLFMGILREEWEARNSDRNRPPTAMPTRVG